jgi:glyoxylase-like metal-dependent hydrolase (beta-lactamase superfamily II)
MMPASLSLSIRSASRPATLSGMCEECVDGQQRQHEKPTRRRLMAWGIGVPAAAAAVTIPFAGTALAHDGAINGSAFYLAKSGDTLKTIAARFLGNADRWTEILSLNSGQLGPDGQPRAGQRLLLPETTTSTPAKTYAPLPAGAKPAPVPPEGYRLEKIGPSVYGVIVGAGQSVFVVTRTGVVLIDAPGTFATALPAAVKKITDKPVTHLIYSHSHFDHIGASGVFGPDVIRIGHEETARILKQNADPARPVPTLTFHDRRTVEIGGERFVLSYPGPSHESGNIIIQVPGQKLAVLIDCALPGVASYQAFGTADSIPGVIRAHKELLKLDFDTFVGGHWYRWGTRRDVAESYEFVSDIWNETARAIAATPQPPFFAKVEPGNTWAALDLWLDALADQAEPVVLAKWINRLGAADVFTRINIRVTAVSQRVDQPHDL